MVLGGGDPSQEGDCTALASYGSTAAVVTNRSLGVFISQGPVIDFDGQIMYEGLTQSDGCVVVAVTSHDRNPLMTLFFYYAHFNDFDGGATPAHGNELQGESLGLTRAGST